MGSWIGRSKTEVFLRLSHRLGREGEKLTQHRFSEEGKRCGENKPGQTGRKRVNQTSGGLRNCKASETQSRDGGRLIDRGMTSLLFITGVKTVLSSLMLW